MNDSPAPWPVALLLLWLVLMPTVWIWTLISQRLRNGLPLINSSSSDAKPWGLVDLVVAFVMVSLSQIVAGAVIQFWHPIPKSVEFSDLSSDARTALMIASSAASTAALVGAVVWLGLRHGGRSLGISPTLAVLRDDVRHGAAAFVAIAPIVYGIQYLLAHWLEPTHPVTDLLEETPSLGTFLLSGLTAVVIAPIMEEFLFRLLLQGWLDRVFRGGRTDWMMGGTPHPTVPLPAAALVDKPSTAEGRPGGMQSAILVLPNVITSIVFAAAHLSYGPSPIPLFVFSLALGYLYQRTQRVVPCIVLHMLLNACSLGLLFLSVSTQP